MSRISFFAFLLLLGGFHLVGAALWESRLDAQEVQKPEPINNIVTVDGIKLSAAFYASPKKNAATVILLHPIGEGKSTKLPGWKTLAETLQKNGFTVMMFDFRGHGDSTTIDAPEEFLKYPYNRFKRAAKEELDVKDYIKTSAYWPVLINDIAAVKAFLDRRHDKGECNTSNTIVIGAETGATLGAIWINSEMYRFKATLDMFGRIQTIEKRAEGNDNIGAVWLNIQPKLGTRTVSVAGILNVACKIKSMPAVFVYGDKDAPAKKYNKNIVDFLKVKGSKKHEGIVQVEVPNTTLSGVKLLNKDLKMDENLAKYLVDNVLPERNNEYEAREFATATYMWKDPRTGVPSLAKKKDEKNLRFDTYEKYIQ